MGCAGLGLPYQFTPCRLDALAVGALLAALVRGPGGLASLVRPAKWVLGVTLAGLVVLCWHNGLRREEAWTPTAGFTLVAFFFGAFLVLCIAARPGGWRTRWIDNGPLRFLGRYSYGMYVYQGVLFEILSTRCLSVAWLTEKTGHYFTSVLIHCAASLVALLAISMVSWHLYEKQFLKLKKYFEYRAAM